MRERLHRLRDDIHKAIHSSSLVLSVGSVGKLEPCFLWLLVHGGLPVDSWLTQMGHKGVCQIC